MSTWQGIGSISASGSLLSSTTKNSKDSSESCASSDLASGSRGLSVSAPSLGLAASGFSSFVSNQLSTSSSTSIPDQVVGRSSSTVVGNTSSLSSLFSAPALQESTFPLGVTSPSTTIV